MSCECVILRAIHKSWALQVFSMLSSFRSKYCNLRFYKDGNLYIVSRRVV